MSNILARSCCLLWLCCGLVLAATEEPLPKIEPGYRPTETTTEKGMWMELEDYESSLRQSALLIKDAPINDYVRNAACRVAGDYCNDFRVYVIRNPSFNASMTANGVMQVWTGLLVRVSSEDELAAVLGHELAHYTQLHSLERLHRIKSSLAASSVIDLLLGLPLAQDMDGRPFAFVDTAPPTFIDSYDATPVERLGDALAAEAVA